MNVLELLKASNRLMELTKGNEKVTFYKDVFYIEGIGKFKLEELLNSKNEKIEKTINFDGISNVRAWEKGPKKRIYFKAVGVKPSLHQKGEVFLELVQNVWKPNLKYKIMQNFASELNEANIKDPDIVEELYRNYIY